MRSTLFYGVIVAVLLTVGYFLVPKNESAIAGDMTKAQIEEIVRDFILQNPEVLLESLNGYQKKQQDQEQAKAGEMLKSLKDDLAKNTTSPVAGNPKGDVTLVEFFDYNCGYCKRAYPTVAQLIKEDSNLKVLFMEFPILSPTSEAAARAALAIHALDSSKYLDFHAKLMNFNGEKTEEILLGFAKELGMDADKVKETMGSDGVNKELEHVRTLAGQISVRGTPAFIVGEQLIPGAVDVATLKNAIAAARSKK